MIKSDTIKFGRARQIVDKAGKVTVIDVIINDITIARLSNNNKHVPKEDGPWDIILADNTHVGRKIGLDMAKAHLYECLNIDLPEPEPTSEGPEQAEPEQAPVLNIDSVEPHIESVEPKKRKRSKDKRWLDIILPQLKLNDSIAVVGCKGSLAPSLFYDMQLVVRGDILYLLYKKGIFQSWSLNDVDYYQNLVSTDVMTVEVEH